LIRSRPGNRTPKDDILSVEIDFAILLSTVFECASSISSARNAEVDLSEKAARLRNAITVGNAKSVEMFSIFLTTNFALKVALENSSTRIIQNAKRL
jgi:hypothetical protein